VNALANEQVGELLNRYFVSTYVKVAAFTLVRGQKQGGNVASYFCLPDGRVLHAIAGQVDANTLVYEMRWAMNVHKQASLEGLGDPARYESVCRKAHAERLQREFGIERETVVRLHKFTPTDGPEGTFTNTKDPLTTTKMQILEYHQRLDNRGRIHLLLGLFPLAKVGDIYTYVFESILKEKISSLPLVEE
jgi:hypothetical protein